MAINLQRSISMPEFWIGFIAGVLTMIMVACIIAAIFVMVVRSAAEEINAARKPKEHSLR